MKARTFGQFGTEITRRGATATDLPTSGAGLFEPDILTAEQWGRRNRRIETRPERLLLIAVVEAAIDDVQRHQGKPRVDAMAWFENSDRAWPYSFLNIAEELGLDAQAVRDQLRAYLERLSITLEVEPSPWSRRRQVRNFARGALTTRRSHHKRIGAL